MFLMSEPHGFPRHRGMYDVIVIGGGLYGCCVALFAREHQTRVALMERGTDLLQRASYKNQARVHKGYHYPRSILTGMRACLNMPRFCLDFKDCVDTTFRNAYAIAAQNTKTNAYQFVRFCQTIGAPVWTATDSLKSLFNSRLIEDVFLVEEYALNTTLLREVLRRRIEAAGVD